MMLRPSGLLCPAPLPRGFPHSSVKGGGSLMPAVVRVAGGGGGVTTIISDTFPDTADLNNRLASPTDVPGTRWGIQALPPSDPGGDGVFVDTNPGTKLQPALTAGLALIDAQHSDGTVQVTATESNVNDVEVLFRVDSYAFNEFWWAMWDLVAQTFFLQKLVGGVPTTVSSISAADLGVGTRIIKVVLNGNSIVATIDGGHQITANDSALATNTVCGFGAGQQNSASNQESFANFKFTTP